MDKKAIAWHFLLKKCFTEDNKTYGFGKT